MSRTKLFQSLTVCAAIAIVPLTSRIAAAQDVTESALKAAFIFNFAKFTEWPADVMTTGEPLMLCVHGDAAIGNALERAVRSRTVLGHRMDVSQATSDGPPREGCHILYVSGVTAGQAAKLVAGLRDAPVLTISDAEGFTQAGGIAQFFFEHGQLRFNVHVESAKRARLRIKFETSGVGHSKMTTTSICTLAASIAITLVLSSSTLAQSRLNDLDLEELMTLDAGQVFGASERLQPAIEAPASVSFITKEEIARYGYRTLADILRSVRGMYIVDDRNYSVVGTRGFAPPGDYNTRILLLVNGHRVNDNVYGQGQIGADFGLDPAMFERVEIIRGPASSLYGDSAFFAVVNVITRTGESLGGGSVTVETGTLGARLVRAAVGHGFASGVDVALSSTYEGSSGVGQLYFPAFDTPGTNNGVAEGLDGEGIRQFYGRVDFKGLTVTGAYGHRQRDVPTASFGAMFNNQDSPEKTTDQRTLIDAAYGRSFSGTRVTIRASFDRFTFDGIYPFAGEPAGAPTLVGHNRAIGMRWSLGSGLTRSFGRRHTVRAGVEFIDNVNQDQIGRYVDPPALVIDRHQSSLQHALYAQDEIRLARWLIFNAGLRYDGYEEFMRVTPRAALVYLPSSTQSVKYLYGSAFRAPNAIELNDVFFGAGLDKLRPESIDTHELVWERYANDWLRTSVSTYWYKAKEMIILVPDEEAFLGLTFVNQGEVRAKGLELEAQMRFKGESRAVASYALQSSVQQETLVGLPNSPRHIAKARVSVPGPTARSFISMEGQYLSSRETLAGSKVSGAAIFNISVVQPLGRYAELYGSVRNIFDAQYSDPVSTQHHQDSILQNGRTARIGLRWKLWSN